MTDTRPPIENPMKREIRQRCGFGCVICGLPIYEYEHMEEWAVVQRHVADEITLLCPNHHAQKTKGLLPIEKVRKHNANPKNLQTGQSAPHELHYDGTSVRIDIGGNWFTRTGLAEGDVLAALVIDGITLIGFTYSDGILLLTLQLYAEDGTKLLSIEENELTYSTGAWDIEFVGKTLTIRQKRGDIWLEVDFLAPDMVRIARAKIVLNGIGVLVRPDCLIDTNSCNGIMGTSARNVPYGIVFGNSPNCFPACIGMEVPRREPVSFAAAEKRARELAAEARTAKKAATEAPASSSNLPAFVGLPWASVPIQILVYLWTHRLDWHPASGVAPRQWER